MYFTTCVLYNMYKQRNVTMEVRARRRGEGEGVKGGKRREGREVEGREDEEGRKTEEERCYEYKRKI